MSAEDNEEASAAAWSLTTPAAPPRLSVTAAASDAALSYPTEATDEALAEASLSAELATLAIDSTCSAGVSGVGRTPTALCIDLVPECTPSATLDATEAADTEASEDKDDAEADTIEAIDSAYSPGLSGVGVAPTARDSDLVLSWTTSYASLANENAEADISDTIEFAERDAADATDSGIVSLRDNREYQPLHSHNPVQLLQRWIPGVQEHLPAKASRQQQK
jgi:hypothetical protein